MSRQTDWTGDLDTPPALADCLLAGTLGREPLVRAAALAKACAADASSATRPAQTRRWHGLLAAALEEDSLHGPTAAAWCAATAQAAPGNPAPAPAFAAMVRQLADRFTIPDHVGYYQRLTARGDRERVRQYLDQECRTGRHRLFWLHVALRQAILEREFDWGEALVAAVLSAESAPLADKLSADLALLAGHPARALARYAAAHAAMPWPSGLFRLGLAAWQAGERQRAITHLQAIVRHQPWHVSACLALFDLLHDRDRRRAPLPGRLAICLYTFNKADDLERTLASLFATALGDATVTVLDNASTDATPLVLSGWQERVGATRLQHLPLPVNIGAPAARNWLLHAAPAVGQADFVVYLDDDVLLPSDWLGRLGTAVEAYPEAGVWGCRVADARNPTIAQGVDATLLPPAPADDPEALPWLSDLHATAFDLGGFAHLRPCLSVMGCCHLFRRRRLLEDGDFDIRFSPSQYDDVDHDLRLALAGRPPVYQGHLVVRHCRPAPVLAPPPTPAQRAGGEANRRKLLAKHQAHLTRLAAELRSVLAADLSDKRRQMLRG